ncbi:MAG: hypothetical protein B7Z75_00270 [Acidocella sp. 20-57-95]|nr:MAG: hypothetical protein B7Z75_00270 [Acidocella sp. 20-57-95]OYV59561.1 MAG: hypothetical protein B7Z71_07790 [Acidocella sp. 21-58-7]HQT63330.1 hypothetical protein [Acidocella sp.]HQU04593.1 hypothetical protein [Acidocella sp.]
MDHAISHDAEAATLLAALLGIISDELAELGDFTGQLQTTLSPALLRLANDPTCHRNVQMLDLLAQRLSVLGLFFVSLAQTIPEGLQIDMRPALNAVTLSELAWRLQGKQGSQFQHPAGELEAF